MRLTEAAAAQPTTCNEFGAAGYGPHYGSVSGMIGMFCARHGFALAGGMVDLQKGERYVIVMLEVSCIEHQTHRYCNIDYIAMSALARQLMDTPKVISYDIIYQWI